jgi:hypothetical protein
MLQLFVAPRKTDKKIMDKKIAAHGRRPARIEIPGAGPVIFLSLIFLSLFVRTYPRVSA